MSRRFLIITITLSVLGFLVQWGFSGFFGLFGSLGQIGLCALLVTIITRLIRRKSGYTFGYTFLRSSLIMATVIGVFSSGILIFIMYQMTFPAGVGKIILTNSEQNIIFYQMSHIATANFYDRVGQLLRDATGSGYTIYREGVLPGTSQSKDRFDTIMGIKWTHTLYPTLAKSLSLVAQDDSLYAGIASGSLQNVDLSLDAIVEYIGTGVSVPALPRDIEAELMRIEPSQYGPLYPYFIRSLLSSFIRSQGDIDTFSLLLDPKVGQVLLSYRNQHVVDTYLREKKKQVVMVYGAFHFEGIFNMLRSRDPRWHIVSVEPLYPYSY